MTNMNSAFDLNSIHLSMDLRTNEIIAQYGDIRGRYSLVEFADSHEASLGEISMVSLMMAVRVKFASDAITLV